MVDNKVHWKVGGAAGQGVKSSGLIFAKACTRGGLNIFGYTEYPSLIKGGHNVYQVRVEDEPVGSLIQQINMLVALDKDTVFIHKDEMAPGGVVIYDGERIKISQEEYGRDDVSLFSVPALKICKDLKVSEIMENQVFLGATFALLTYDFSFLEGVIRSEFGGKGEKVVDEDLSAARAGYDYACQNYDCNAFPHNLNPIEDQPKKMVITGNDATALGAVRAGCKFYAAYPMTPATSILHTLAAVQHDYGMVVKHAEDEISVVNMTIGAGYAGVRAMCATSGGGFALMNEGYSLAGITETPLVIVEVMRGGPATGIPTWTEQGDLKFVLNAGHGEFPRFVLTPGDPEECYYLMEEAFNIADEYQTPVIVLTDKHVGESHWSYPFFDKPVEVRRGPWASNEEIQAAQANGERYKRYSFDAPNGVSKRVVPGQHKNGIFIVNSDEHDEYGYSSEEIENRVRMSGKRMQKADAYKAVMPQPNLYGPQDADLTITCWGSSKPMVVEAVKWLNDEGYKVNALHLTHVAPFPCKRVKEVITAAKHVLNVEHNATAQMASVIREHTGFKITENLLRNDGRIIFPGTGSWYACR